VHSYSTEIDFLRAVEEKDNQQNGREKLAAEEISSIKTAYANLPEDYLDYLQCVGWGSFRGCQFMVFSFPEALSDLGIASEIDDISSYVFFGDNFAGNFSGFNLQNGEVVEWWHDTDEIYATGKTFQEYIRAQMLMDENGNDTKSH
jgi:hypothetical protein